MRDQYYGLWDNLIYDGEEKDGKWHGWGIEYHQNAGDMDHPPILYEGEHSFSR
ncbi:hypothetical protein RZN25_18070 [Bacillaceae bacterium S4-13-56]